MNKVSDIFNIQYGNNFELVSLEKRADGINFISRTSKNNGVSAKVKKLSHITPFSSGLITVAVSGSVLEAFLQNSPFYTGYHVMVLTPKVSLTIQEKLYYCHCIRMNKYKYSYGRQANSTLKDLLIPSLQEIPESIKSFSIKEYGNKLLNSLSVDSKKCVKIESNSLVLLSEIFDVVNGIASSEVKRFKEKKGKQYLPYLRPSYRQETCIDAFVNKETVADKYIFPKNTLYVSTDGQGSHTFSYVSTFEFVPNSNIAVLLPRREMSLEEKLYYAYCITMNRYKFSYGRKPKGDRLKTVVIPKYAPEEIYQYTVTDLVKKFQDVLESL